MAPRPRIVLGVVDGLHDAGAAVVIDGRIVAAVNEERFTRVKLQGGLPQRSIESVLSTAGIEARDVDHVAVAGLGTPTIATRLFRPLQRVYARSLGICFDRPWHPVDRAGDLVRYRLPLTRSRSNRGGRLEAALAEPLLRRALPGALGDAPLSFVDHHLAHAESAWRTAGDGRWLVVTADAHGDGRSLTAWVGDAATGRLALIHDEGVHESVGAFYSYVTRALGFRPGRHEGKVLGLSARGDASKVDLPFPFDWDGGGLVYRGAWGLKGSRRMRVLRDYRREHVAAWVQAGTERVLVEGVKRWLERTDLDRIAVAGGVFANVCVNGLLAGLDGVRRLHVFPHMGDGGLAAGAALHVAGRAPYALGSANVGPDLDERDVVDACRASGFSVSEPADPDAVLVDALARGEIVARCEGRMEFGPRALGHRSVLAPADRPEITETLNTALQRDWFMPFAPLLRFEDGAASFDDFDAARAATRFMTVALRAKRAFAQACPAAVHVDGTARPQTVVATEDPALHRLVTAYVERTSIPAVINTSFNIHEEPIVHTPRDAVRAFRAGGLRTMRLGRCILKAR